ncbi:alpha/beta hydrolase [Sulfurimonas sp. HSL3-7]|uniref:alpha/beta hydrolase n=1 Tax=Sulfonitrofixus jiaomeiensis TaxID=3131938 RepID=UPI0031F9639B
MQKFYVNIYKATVLLLVLAIYGCSTRYEPAQTTELDGDGWIAKDSFYEKTVHFGTTRPDKCQKYLGHAEGQGRLADYTECAKDPLRLNTGNSESAQVIKYGRAKVKIPYIKKVGGTSGMSLSSLDYDIGWEKFISELTERDLLIFIHGFNTSFSNAAIRCAQLAHDTNFNGEAIFYSWPSKENPATYSKDKDRARENFVFFANFLQDIAGKTDKKIHIVAHSMGTYILMNSLAILDDRMSKDDHILSFRRSRNNGKIFAQIILAAPDIAKDDYYQSFSKHNFQNMAENITLYSAANDHVLDSSQIVNYFIEGTAQARLGDSSKEFFVIDGMDTVDTRQEISHQFFGHSFYANYRSLVSDMHLSLRYGAPPNSRMLQEVIDKKGNHLWFIRD